MQIRRSNHDAGAIRTRRRKMEQHQKKKKKKKKKGPAVEAAVAAAGPGNIPAAVVLLALVGIADVVGLKVLPLKRSSDCLLLVLRSGCR